MHGDGVGRRSAETVAALPGDNCLGRNVGIFADVIEKSPAVKLGSACFVKVVNGNIFFGGNNSPKFPGPVPAASEDPLQKFVGCAESAEGDGGTGKNVSSGNIGLVAP